MAVESSVPQQETVLIGFADALSAPEVAWSLVDAGFRVVAFAKRGRRSALQYSHWVEVLEVSDPSIDVAGTLDDIKAVARQLTNPIVMPLDDASLWLVNELSRDGEIRVAGATGKLRWSATPSCTCW